MVDIETTEVISASSSIIVKSDQCKLDGVGGKLLLMFSFSAAVLKRSEITRKAKDRNIALVSL